MEHVILAIILILCAIAGLFLGPGYVLYCVSFSGKRVSENVVFKRHGTEPNPACVPVKIRLTPEMNPIEVRYLVRYQPSDSQFPGERFLLRLMPPAGNAPAWACAVPKASKDDAGRSYFGRVARFNVSETGLYRIEVARNADPALPASRVKLDIRRNVKRMNSTIALGGIFMLVGSLVAVPIVTPPTVVQESVSGAADANPPGAPTTSPSSPGEPEIIAVAAKGSVADLQRILVAGAGVNTKDAQGQTALHAAAAAGQLDAMTMLLAHGADVNARDDQFQTPLLLAAERGDLASVRLLLAALADPNLIDKSGYAPLHYAVHTKQPDEVKLLLAKGAIVDARTKDGLTPLMFASYPGNVASLNLLLAAGADVNLVSANGRFPLMLAAQGGDAEEVKLLLAAHADPTQKDLNGHDALWWATSNNHPDVMAVLQKYEAASAPKALAPD